MRVAALLLSLLLALVAVALAQALSSIEIALTALEAGCDEDRSDVARNDSPSSRRRLLSLWPTPTIRYFEVSEASSSSNRNIDKAAVSVVLVNGTIVTVLSPTNQNPTVWSIRAIPSRTRVRSIQFVHYYESSTTTSTFQPNQIMAVQTQITNTPNLVVNWSLAGSGRHVIAATPYSRRKAQGRAGPVRTIVVVVANENAVAPAMPLSNWHPTRTPVVAQRPVAIGMTTRAPSTASRSPSTTTAPFMPLTQPLVTLVPAAAPSLPPAAIMPTRVGGVVPIALPTVSAAPQSGTSASTLLPMAAPFLTPPPPLPAAVPMSIAATTAAPQASPETCTLPRILSQSVDIVVTTTQPKVSTAGVAAAALALVNATNITNTTNTTTASPTRAPMAAASPVTNAPHTNNTTNTTNTTNNTTTTTSNTTNTTNNTTNTTTINNVTFTIQLELADIALCADQVVFAQAAYTWQSIIAHDLADIDTAAEGLTARDDGCTWPAIIDDLYICATYARIDGPSKVLGYAGPEYVRNDNLLPISGIMVFDKSDLAMLRQGNGFLDTILHEMGHVIGLGSLWQYANLATEAPNCTYLGVHANAEYQALSRCGRNATLPLERKGGRGTACVHWDEDCLGDELMTGYLSTANGDSMRSPLSRLSIAAVQDLGYDVDYSRANPFGREKLDPLCTCPNRRRLGSFKDSTMRNGRGPRPRQRRRLGDAAHALAVQAGLDFLQSNRAAADAAKGTTPGLRYVGDTVVSVLVADQGHVYGVLVHLDNDR
jgi:Leishmanolysin